MATNVQVNAQTSQAVGAFNALANSIQTARNSFNQLAQSMAQGAQNAQMYGSALNNGVTRSLDILGSAFEKLLSVIKVVGNAMMTMTTSLLKEMDKIQGFNAMMSVTTKSTDETAKAYNFLRSTADRLGIQFDALTANYGKLMASIPEGVNRLDTVNRAFLGISMAARTMHASNQTTQLMFYAISQMASKGTVSMEELRRQLAEKLPGTMQIAAKALNTTTTELEQAIRKGTVDSVKFLNIFGDALIRTFSESSEIAATSVSASINRLTNVWVDFSKAVLDSGAGTAIVGVFDALRIKLSDPYVIERFAELIKHLAERLTGFINGLTQDDIRNGFDAFARGIDFMVTVVGKLIEAFNWIINHGKVVGAIIGGIAGATTGMMTAGPWGSLILGVAGAAGGAYIGGKLNATPEDIAAREAMDRQASAAVQQKNLEQSNLVMNQMLPLLKSFNVKPEEVSKLFTPERANKDTIEKMVSIFNDKRFKTPQAQREALIDFSKHDEILNPDTTSLKDVLGGKGKNKPTSDEKRLDRREWEAMGFSGEFKQQAEDYITLLKTGRLSADQFDHAMAELMYKQPFMAKQQKELNHETREYNKGLEESIAMALKKVEMDERLKSSLDDELKLAGMRAEDAQIESRIMQEQESRRRAGLEFGKVEIEQMREKLRLIRDTHAIQGAMDNALAMTVDKYKPQIDQIKGFDKLMSDPKSGFGQGDAQDILVQQNPQLMGGTKEGFDKIEKDLKDTYAYIDLLRKKDLVSEQTAQSMKVKAWSQSTSLQLHTMDSFWENLASLQHSKSKTMAKIGQAAAIVQTTIKTYESATSAYAAMAGIPYVGPALGAAAAAAAVAAGMANIQAIRSQGAGFQSGGYTGSGLPSEVAGVVHGQEFVVNAAATARNRETLEAMNRGMEVGRQSGVSIKVENYGTSKTYEVEQLSENEIRIIARDEAKAMVQTETHSVVASALQNPNSKISKSLGSNTKVQRRR